MISSRTPCPDVSNIGGDRPDVLMLIRTRLVDAKSGDSDLRLAADRRFG
jgi:hypothetical protein